MVIINHGQIVLDDRVKNLKYHYLRKKIVDLRFSAAPPKLDIAGAKILKSKDTGLKLEVDTGIAGIDGVISAILRQGEVQDISISDPPLEAIIADIFTAKEEGA